MYQCNLVYCTLTPSVLRFSVLIGPINHIKHLVSRERLPFSIAYLGSLGLTLYFALGVCALYCLLTTLLTKYHTATFVLRIAHWRCGSGTLYKAGGLSIFSHIIKILALVSYVMAYFPGGAQTLRFGGQMALRGAGSLLPV